MVTNNLKWDPSPLVFGRKSWISVLSSARKRFPIRESAKCPFFAPSSPRFLFFLKLSVWWRIFRESLAPVIFKILDKESMFIPSDTGRSHLNLAMSEIGTDWVSESRIENTSGTSWYLFRGTISYIYMCIYICVYIYILVFIFIITRYYKRYKKGSSAWLLPGLPPLSLNFTWCSWQIWNPVKNSLVHLLLNLLLHVIHFCSISCVIVRFGYIQFLVANFFDTQLLNGFLLKFAENPPLGGFFMMFNHVSSRELCLFFYEYIVKFVKSPGRPLFFPIFLLAPRNSEKADSRSNRETKATWEESIHCTSQDQG